MVAVRATGDVGATGAMGAVGATRGMGAVGATRAMGATGAVGATRAMGATGAVGATGAAVTVGAAGAVGGTSQHVWPIGNISSLYNKPQYKNVLDTVSKKVIFRNRLQLVPKSIGF